MDTRAPRFEGLSFVPVAEARSESALVAAVASALGESTADVGHALAARGEVLVILDNVEQVAPSAAEVVARWVRLAPRARFLVTSRERLRIESEACLELAPLDDADAARLFVDRAAIARGRYAPSDAEMRAVRELVKHLDGNPLAIELAAARTKMFSADELLARIGKRFELLTGSARSLVEAWELARRDRLVVGAPLGRGEARARTMCRISWGIHDRGG